MEENIISLFQIINIEKKISNQFIYENIEDIVLCEKKIIFIINNKNNISLIASDDNLADLITGFLYKINAIDVITDILKIKTLDEEYNINEIRNFDEIKIDVSLKGKKNIHTYLSDFSLHKQNINEYLIGKKVKSNFNIHYSNIKKLIDKANNLQCLFKKTGASHSVIIFNNLYDILILREDLNRHNSLDKAIGAFLSYKQKNSNESFGLFISGRVDNDVLFSCIKSSFEIVLSPSAPTYNAIKLANKFGVTLCGFARNNSINIYTKSIRVNY